MPLNWAATQNNLGNALWTLGERESSVEKLRSALQAVKNSRSVYIDEAQQTHHKAYFEQLIAGIQKSIDELSKKVIADNEPVP